MMFLLGCGRWAAAAAAQDKSNDPVKFCVAQVPESSSRRIEAHAWSTDLIATVAIEALPLEAMQALKTKYKGRPPRPKLVPIVQYRPMIPFDMRAMRIPGRAEAFVLIGRSGMVSEVYLADCTNSEYAQAIGLSLKSWRFEPLVDECLIEVPIRIDLVPQQNPK